MTNRIVSNQSGPTVQFILEGDAVAEASYGTNGRWKITTYLKCVNTGTSSSAFSGPGTQDARSNGTVIDTHSGDPFLPAVAAGATRWRDGPTVTYRVANAQGYWTGTSTSLAVQMRLDYGGIDTTPVGAIPLPRIARAPSAPGTPTVTALGSSDATFGWAAAAPGNAPIANYGVYVARDAAFTDYVYQAWVGTVLTKNVPGLAPGTKYWMRTRASNADGTGPYTPAVAFTTLAGVYVSDGTAWNVAEVLVSDGSAWRAGAVTISDGTSWKAPV